MGFLNIPNINSHPNSTITYSNDGALNDQFKSLVGRDFTSQEKSYFDNLQGWANKSEAVAAHAAGMQQQAQEIFSLAQAYGISDFTLDDANKLRDQTYKLTASGTIQDAAKIALDRRLSEQTTSKLQEQIDRQMNPGKYLTPEQKAQNQATATRLLQTTFGADYNDPDMADFLSQRLAEGESAFEVSQFLQSTPQYMKRQSEIENKRVADESLAAREALSQELLKGEEEAYKRATPQIIASFMRAGRLGSSGLESVLAKSRADLERERQGFLANAAYQDAIRGQGYRREDFVGANAQAFNQYLRQNEPAYQQRFALQGIGNQLAYQQPFANLQRSYALADEGRQRQYALEDYSRQQSDYNRYLSDQRRYERQNLPYQLLGSAIGAGLQGWASGGFK